jgi:hypothetical protein
VIGICKSESTGLAEMLRVTPELSDSTYILSSFSSRKGGEFLVYPNIEA